MAVSHQDLVSLYKAILTSLSCVVNDDMVSLSMEGDIAPVLIDNKRLVVPTPDVLRVLASNPWVAFHPMGESIVRGESPVLKRLRMLVNSRLTYSIYKTAFGVLATAADTSRHSALPPTLTQIVSDLGDVDEKTIANLNKVFGIISPNGEYRLINIFLRRGGEMRGVPQRRTAIVTFPFMTEQLLDPENVCGTKWRKKDVVAVTKLMKLIVPDEDYSTGSNSDVAPYFEALMRAYVSVATAVNAVSWKFRKHIPDYEQVHIDLSWVDQVKDLTPYKGVINALPGNDGDNVNGTPTPTAEQVPALQRTGGLGAAPVTAAPAALGAAAPVTQPGGLGVPPVINTVVASNGVQRRVASLGADASTVETPLGNTQHDDGSSWFSMIRSTMYAPQVLPRFRAVGDTAMPAAIAVAPAVAPGVLTAPVGGLGVPGQGISALASFQMAMQPALPVFKPI